MNHTLVIGKFGATHGVRGWIKVYSYTDPTKNILTYTPWLIHRGAHWETLTVTQSKPQESHFLIKLEHTNTPEDAQQLVQHLIYTYKSNLPTLHSDEYYWNDLEGLSVVTIKGVTLGKVDHLFSTGANDILCVLNETHQERLIPYIKEVIKRVDLTEKTITVDWDPNF